MSRFASLALVLLLACLWCGVGAAAPAGEAIATRIAELEQAAGDPASQSLLQTYYRAQAFLESGAAHAAATRKLEDTLRTGPETLRELEAERATFERRSALPPITSHERRASTEELERLLDEAVTRRLEIENRLAGFERQGTELRARPAALAAEKAQASARIAELETALSDEAAGESGAQAEGTRAAMEAELAARQAERERLAKEQLSLSLRADLIEARRARAAAELTLATTRVEAIEQLLRTRRQDELATVQASAAEAARAAAGADPRVQKLARQNTVLSEELSELVGGQDRAASERTRYNELRQRIAADFEQARERVELAGSWSGVGHIMVDQRRQLPQPRALAREAKLNEGRVTRIGVRRIELDEQLRSAEAGLAAADDPQARTLLEGQVELLKSLNAKYASYLRSLDATDFELQQLATLVTSYRGYLDEHLLWLRNAPPITGQFLLNLARSAELIFSPGVLTQAGHDILAGGSAGGVRVLALLALAAGLFGNRGRLKRLLAEYAARCANLHADRLRHTVLALLVTSLHALPWPLVLAAVAELFRSGYEAAEGSLALAQVLRFAAILTFVFLWIGALLANGGVARAHLRWPEAIARPLRRAWLRLLYAFVPFYAAAVMLEWYGNPAIQFGLRRLLFLIAMASVAGFAYWLTRRHGPVRRELTQWWPDAWYSNAWPFWSMLAGLPPLVLMVLAAFGYQYTAIALSRYYLASALLLFGALLLYQLALRWLLVAERRLVIRRAQAQAAALGPDGEADDAATLNLDLATVNSQTRLILRNVAGWTIAFGLFLVWQDVLPALGVFENITLWQIEVKSATGELQLQPVTIASLGLAVIIAVITVVAARNIPGVLEIALLQKLDIHHGSRYAISTLAQYLIVALGIGFGLSTLGLRWSQIQWLIAALGVGLGFGLQEIFANFISGIILLFERPIRVGDVVTIADRTGSVQRIDIRATRIRDGDNREIIVPNKTFITERFINWTLNDQVTRVVIRLGVGHDSDPILVQRLLLELAIAHPQVMDEPAPGVMFQSIGDSALNFELSFSVAELGHRVTAAHDLHVQIKAAFAAHGIALPVPQRDVRVRSWPPGSVAAEAAVAPPG